MSRARFEGVQIRIRGGVILSGVDGLARSWNMSSIRVCVFPVCSVSTLCYRSCEKRGHTPGGPCIEATCSAKRQNRIASF